MGIIDRIKLWWASVNPSTFAQTIEQYKNKGNLKEAAINVFLASLVPAIVVFLRSLAFGAMLEIMSGALVGMAEENLETATAATAFDIFLIAGFINAIVVVITIFIGFFIGQGICWIFAKVLGGAGSYTNQTYLSSLIFSFYYLIVPVPLYLIPCVGSLLSFIILLYIPLYLQYRIIKAVHQLSTARAAAVTLISLLIAISVHVLLGLALTVIAYVAWGGY